MKGKKSSESSGNGQKNILTFFKGSSCKPVSNRQTLFPVVGSSTHSTNSSANKNDDPKPLNDANDDCQEDGPIIIPDTPDGVDKSKVKVHEFGKSREARADEDVIPDTPDARNGDGRKHKAFHRSYLSSSRSLVVKPRPIVQGKVTKSKVKKGVPLEERLKTRINPAKTSDVHSAVLSEIGQYSNNFSNDNKIPTHVQNDGFEKVSSSLKLLNGKRGACQGISPNPKRVANRKTPKKSILENRYTKMAKKKRLFDVDAEPTESALDEMTQNDDDVSELKWGVKMNSNENKASFKLQSRQSIASIEKAVSAKTNTDEGDEILDDVLQELKLKSVAAASNEGHIKPWEKKALSSDTRTMATSDVINNDDSCDDGIDDLMNELKTKLFSPESKLKESDKERLDKYNSIINFTPKSSFKKGSAARTSTPCKPFSGTSDGSSFTSHTNTPFKSDIPQPSAHTTIDALRTSHVIEQNECCEEDKNSVADVAMGTVKTTDEVNKDFEIGDSFLADISMEENDSISEQFAKLSPYKKPTNNFSSEDFPSCHKFGRHSVTCVDQGRTSVDLGLKCEFTGRQRKAVLEGFWMDTHVSEGDIVNIIGEFDSSGACQITDSQNLIVVNPDLLISGTSVVSGLHCMRRSVLNEIFKGCDSKNIHMLHGSILHSFFQQVLKEKAFSSVAMEKVAKATLEQKKFLHEMYGMSIKEESVMDEITKLLPQVEQFISKHVSSEKQDLFSNKPSGESIRITDIVDIEENIWSPRYGVKGKIDLTVGVKIHANNRLSWQQKYMPLELKTGRASFSAEHQGQVTLYSLMSCDRRDDPEGGLLLYLKHGQMKMIPAKTTDVRGLIQLRNEMAYYFSKKANLPPRSTESKVNPEFRGHLPPPLNNERFCTTCPHLLNCTAYQKVIEDYHAPSGHVMHSLTPGTLAHLSNSHLDYFGHWCRLLHLESVAGKKHSSDPRHIWCTNAQEREKNRLALSGLVLVAEECCQLGLDSFSMAFSRHMPSGQRAVNEVLVVNDNVVISAQNKTQISLTSGTVTDISASTVHVMTDRDLRLYEDHKSTIYRLDKVDTYNAMATSFSSLSLLMANSPRSSKLREIIIDKKKPDFDPTLSKTKLEQVMSILKRLNKPQKIAIVKVLLCKDYVLIKGFPGTGKVNATVQVLGRGKTTTIVTLVRVLEQMGLSVLLTSYTHSAVDNILLKMIKFGCKFVRLGRQERIHPGVRSRSADTLASHVTNTQQLEELYNSMPIVATTCLGVSSHPVFSRRKFDVCIIDEASQVLQPACFRALSACERFVLVGDPLQLPPVVQSKEARQLGMSESLFARLDDTGATYELNLQYRMNKPIMRLSNELVYDGALQCGAPSIASARLALSTSSSMDSHPDWLIPALSNGEGHEVVVMDTDLVVTDDNMMSGVTNILEAKVVAVIANQLVQCGVSEDNIGVIAPYNQQVLLLKATIQGQGLSKVEVNTVDQYQGRDKDVIIISFAKSKTDNGPVSEILQDTRRLNVAITRPRHKLILVGSVGALRQYSPCQQLLDIISEEHVTHLPADLDLHDLLSTSAS